MMMQEKEEKKKYIHTFVSEEYIWVSVSCMERNFNSTH